MNRFRRPFCLFAMALAAYACSAGEKKRSGGDSADALSSPLFGTWEAPCTSRQGESMRSTRAFTATEVTIKQVTYTSNDCSGSPVDQLEIVAAYTITSYNAGDISKIDYDLQKASLMPLADGYDKLYNQQQFFGYSDWRLNAAKDITDKSSTAGSPPAFARGSKQYSVFKLDGDKMYGPNANSGDGLTPDKRPTAVDVAPSVRVN